jgi:hypothetical protein
LFRRFFRAINQRSNLLSKPTLKELHCRKNHGRLGITDTLYTFYIIKSKITNADFLDDGVQIFCDLLEIIIFAAATDYDLK